MIRRFLLVLAALTFGACDDNLPVSSFIDKLRVLGVQADPPEIAPSSTSTLNVLAVEPGKADMTALWLACRIPPGVASPLPCGLATSDGSVATTLPPDCGPTVDGTLCVLSHTIAASVTPVAGFVDNTSTDELLLTVVVADTSDGAEACFLGTAQNDALPIDPDHCVIGIKRVTVSGAAYATPPNHNPRLDRLDLVDDTGYDRSLTAGDASIAPSPSDKTVSYHLTTSSGADAAEQKGDGTYEALSLSWFTNGGSIDGGRSTFDPPGCDSQTDCASKPPITTAETTWDAPKAAMEVGFWAVIRDDRGGVGWIVGTSAVK